MLKEADVMLIISKGTIQPAWTLQPLCCAIVLYLGIISNNKIADKKHQNEENVVQNHTYL